MKGTLLDNIRIPVYSGVLCVLMLSLSYSQHSLLDEDESYYKNYATSSYSKEVVEERLDEYYDLFGEYITNGFYIYSLDNQRYMVSSSTVSDSTVSAYSNELREDLFFDNFRNFIYTRDAVAGVKTAFIIGHQIPTKFSPLTFNKRNYEGIRWDLAYNDLSLTTLISRTRPGLMARYTGGGTGLNESTRNYDSYVTYPMQGVAQTYYSEDEWNSKDNTVDWTARTAFGEYDFLWALHARKKIMDKFDVGLTYVNHHHSTLQKGEKLLGDLPSALAPDEIHFEFYDLTHSIESDPGVKLNDITMTVTTTGGVLPAQRPDGYYRGDSLWVFPAQANAFPYVQDGEEPFIVTFYPKEAAGSDSARITDISFNIDVAGNYLVFVSTDRIGPLYNGRWLNNQYTHKQIWQIATPHPTIPGSTWTDSVDIDEPDLSELYYGDYILRSPGIARSDDDNRVQYDYHFTMPTARIVYGIDFKGKVLNTSVQGEMVLNNSRDEYPGNSGDVISKYNLAAYLNLSRALRDNLDVTAKIYNFDPGYQPYLPQHQISRYLDRATYKSGASEVPLRNIHPVGIGNNYTTIDDNEDDDYYVENNRREYPSNDASTASGGYFQDGTRMGVSSVSLPSAHRSYSIVYDDIDGVIPDRYDRNKNGVLDYQEDFLLYQADPPLFDLEPDMNNNTIPDGQEDDIYPDYPMPVSYALTSNGFKSLGVRGFEADFTFDPLPNFTLTSGVGYKYALDQDFDGEAEAIDNAEGRALLGYARATYRLTRRDLGINVFLGQEIKYAKDGLRDDVVESFTSGNSTFYYLNSDVLRYRNAFVSNTAASVNFLNIPNFELTTRLALLAEKHIAESGDIYLTQIYFNRDIGYGGFRTNVFDYKDTFIGGGNFIVKAAYDFRFKNVPSYLSFLKDLTITPQYKLMYDFSSSSVDDPREIDDYSNVLNLSDEDSLYQAAVRDWILFDSYNTNRILSVPILRLQYPVSDKMILDCGWQFKRNFNMLVQPNNHFKESRVIQIMTSDSYLSFNVAMQLGYRWERTDYDINYFHPAYLYGAPSDTRSSSFFIRLYSGI